MCIRDRSKTFLPTSPQAKGLEIFRQARRTVLWRQMRAAGDPQFQQVLKQVRSTEEEPPIPQHFIRDLKELSAADVRADPTRAFAPILVLGNQERHRLNKHQAYAFAKYYNVPLVRWKLPVAGKDAAALSDEVLTNLYDNEPGMWGYFVRGAPSMLLRNIQPTKNLANGSMGWQESLTFDPDPPPEVQDPSWRTTTRR